MCESGTTLPAGGGNPPDSEPLREKHDTVSKAQTMESLHKNIDIGNLYRLESLKLMLTLATGLLAFTVTFRPTLSTVADERLVYWSWSSLGASVVAGIGVMLCWERFYLSYRLDWHGKLEWARKRRTGLTWLRRTLLVIQFGAFAYGVIGVATFAAENFKNVTPTGH